MDNRVFVISCPDYDQSGEKTAELLDMMGGMERFAASGESIALKVNLLLAARPEDAVTTHPEVVKAMASLVKGRGAAPLIVDSPGGGYRYSPKTLEKTYQKTGMTRAAEESGAELNWDCSHQLVSFPEGRLVKRFEVITPVLDADGVFNLCKLKTHMFTYMTGAVKNHFGVIPGLSKPGHHAKLRDTGRFAAMLLDLTELVGARLFIMDAVLTMEGEGPMAGEPRRVGLLLGSTNPVALDAVGGEIMGLDPENNPVLVEAEKRGLGPTRLRDVDLVGIEARSLRVRDFKGPSTYYAGHGLGASPWYVSLFLPLFKNGMSVRPKVDEKKCAACGICVKACPMGAVALKEKRHAFIDDDLCIRCYCCHEMCPEKAIELRRGLLYRLIRPAGAV
ncbi:MAG: DUF362 domain-containing protein [Proteobacteria bacterium]|nr:DUF362 domain-containing protein [Pseudomonadota bacterium]